MRDRQHLRLLGEALERRGHRVRSHAADTGVDLVEDERLPSRDRGECERHPGQLSAGRGFGHGTEGQTGVRSDEEDRLVHARRAKLAFA